MVGSAVMMMETSRAEMKERMHRATKVPQKRRGFLSLGEGIVMGALGRFGLLVAEWGE
jgi:hypothetical protein